MSAKPWSKLQMRYWIFSLVILIAFNNQAQAMSCNSALLGPPLLEELSTILSIREEKSSKMKLELAKLDLDEGDYVEEFIEPKIDKKITYIDRIESSSSHESFDAKLVAQLEDFVNQQQIPKSITRIQFRDELYKQAEILAENILKPRLGDEFLLLGQQIRRMAEEESMRSRNSLLGGYLEWHPDPIAAGKWKDLLSTLGSSLGLTPLEIARGKKNYNGDTPFTSHWGKWKNASDTALVGAFIIRLVNDGIVPQNNVILAPHQSELSTLQGWEDLWFGVYLLSAGAGLSIK